MNMNRIEDKEKLISEISKHYRAILELIGEDPNREGLVKTPYRAAKALVEITDGYNRSAEETIKSAVFNHDGSRMVVVKDIEFYSLCEHHILPFFGKISIGYIPDGKIIGISKLARVVDVFAKRLQVQEQLTHDICNAITENLPQKGVIVYCEAGHMCMKMRGVEKQESTTVTMDYNGNFEDVDFRNAFFNYVK